MMTKIIENKAKCLMCGDIIESKHRHDYVTCSCGNLSVDGGTDYLRRNFRGTMDSWIDISISEVEMSYKVTAEEDNNNGETL